MTIPTENVGSLPRPARLQAAIAAYDAGTISFDDLAKEQDDACRDSIERMEATGASIISDGEQRASSFATYPITDTLAGTGSPTTSPPTGNTSRSSTTDTTANCPAATMPTACRRSASSESSTRATRWSRRRSRSPTRS
jgi:methionine synthase II (cobalamin-independent)